MYRKLLVLVPLALFFVLANPAQVDAYGAAHVGYTHVGPSGVYHTGTTVASGPRGTYETHTASGTTAGGVHYGYGEAAGGVHYGYGTAAGGVHYGSTVYAPSYYGNYGYVR
jgi:hypothetical protein